MMTPLTKIHEDITGSLDMSLPKAAELFPPLRPSSKVPAKNQFHPSRKRRRAEIIAPCCPL